MGNGSQLTGVRPAMTAKIAIVGSVAARAGGFPIGRMANDLDIICHSSDFYPFIASEKILWSQPTAAGQAVKVEYSTGEQKIIEAEFTDGNNPTSRKVFNAIRWNAVPSKRSDFVIYTADLDMLYLLKMSHRYKKNSPHFLKTMSDIKIFRKYGAVIRDEELYKERMLATYGEKHPNLNRTKEDFFRGDSVDYIYDHDSLHEAVARFDRPMYTRYAIEGHEVLSSKLKFDMLSYSDRIQGVLEETYVLALERSLIPHPDATPEQAFLTALEKVCTSITSGWFREFAWENYDEIVSTHTSSKFDYVEAFNRGVKHGVVRSYK